MFIDGTDTIIITFVFYTAMIVAGIFLLVWSADKFTDGAAAIANNFGVSPLIIGLTIVAIGSSAPEMVISLNAALDGVGSLAVGNAIGSNIANVGMVLGITALISPLTVQSETLKREIPVLFAMMVLAFILMLDESIDSLDASILFIVLAGYLIWLIRIALGSRNKDDSMLEEIIDEMPEAMSTKLAIFWVTVGLIILQLSSKLLVYGATEIAHSFGISKFVIGATIVAVGTSLPELAACISGVKKGEHELAIGNIIGSNIFNLLAVLGIPGFITFQYIDKHVLYIDYIYMVILTVIFSVMAYGERNQPGKISRFEATVLLLLFIVYQAYQFWDISQVISPWIDQIQSFEVWPEEEPTPFM